MIAMNKWRRIKMYLTTIKQQQSSLVHTSYYVSDKEYSTPEIMAMIFGLTDDDYDTDEEAYLHSVCANIDTLVWVHGTKEITEQYIKVR